MKVERNSLVDSGGLTWKICTRLLFICPLSASETAECICETIEIKLFKTTGFKIESFEKKLTFVTD